MDTRFSIHNTHWSNPEQFSSLDPHLRKLSEQILIYRSPILSQLPESTPGIYSLTGGRQIGKTTVIKQWMGELIAKGIKPDSILYVTGELIDDQHSLVNLLTGYLEDQASHVYVLLDEVTYIKDWDKGIKFIADAGLLENATLILTGSDTVIIQDARMSLPGRRGESSVCDFHMFPLSFYEYIELSRDITPVDLQAALSDEQPPSKTQISELEEAFISYLNHGGYLTAINDVAKCGEVRPSTYATYSDWIRGDVLKRNKQEHYLKEILTAIIRSYGSQVTWNSLARSLSIDHSMTVADYVALLARMDAVFIQPALREDRLGAAPKKAKKVMFVDPFIYRATCKWLNLDIKEDAELTGKLVEACAATHYHRFYPTYYIKGKGEIDIAYVEGNRFFPVEVKWTGQVRPGTLKMLSNYKNSKLLCRQYVEDGMVHGIAAEQLPLALLKMGPSPVVKQD